MYLFVCLLRANKRLEKSKQNKEATIQQNAEKENVCISKYRKGKERPRISKRERKK